MPRVDSAAISSCIEFQIFSHLAISSAVKPIPSPLSLMFTVNTIRGRSPYEPAAVATGVALSSASSDKIVWKKAGELRVRFSVALKAAGNVGDDGMSSKQGFTASSGDGFCKVPLAAAAAHIFKRFL